MRLQHSFTILLLTALFITGSTSITVSAIEPVNPNLSPEARKVLDYLESVYEKNTLIGQNKFGDADKALKASGKYPAIVSVDLCGWNKQKWHESYTKNLQRAIDQCKEHYLDHGGIVSMEWHWSKPLSGEGTYEATKTDYGPAFDVGKAVTPGTEEYKAVMEDLRTHADYLEQLRNAGVPVLWRPLHEIDGGWFWWTDGQTPENTAKLWRLMYDYFVNERKLDNLIWVYSAALCAKGQGKDVEAIDFRRRFYPGDQYVDISGIDIYTSDWVGWKDYTQDAHQRAFDIMSRVTPGKMLALTECQGMPSPEIMAKDGPRWLYCLPWYVGGENWNPPEWVGKVYSHELLISRDELPELRLQKKAE